MKTGAVAGRTIKWYYQVELKKIAFVPSLFQQNSKIIIMPWYNGDYPPSYKNQPEELRNKAVEIANEMLLNGADEGIAIATGLKRAREFFEKQGTHENPSVSKKK